MLFVASAVHGLQVPMVKDHVTRSMLSLDSEDNLMDAARLLKRSRITGAPVYEDNALDGILSRNDLLRAVVSIPSDAEASDFEQQLKVARTKEVWRVCTSKPETVSPDASMIEASQILAENKINRLMVKSKASPVLGIISSTDVVFAFLGCGGEEGCSTEGGAADDEPIDWNEHVYVGREEAAGFEDEDDDGQCNAFTAAECVREHMATELITVSPDDNLEDAARVLKEAHVTGAPVMQGSKVVGVLSRNDLLKALAKLPADDGDFAKHADELRERPVRDVMTQEPQTIFPSISMLDAGKIMARDRLNRLLVTNESGELCGIVSSTDVVFVLLGGCTGDDDLDDEECSVALRSSDRTGHMGTTY